MLAPRGVLACCAMIGVACAPEPRLSRVVLEPPAALGCRPTDVGGVQIAALGDFPASGANVLAFDPAAPIDPVDRFPADTRLLVIEATGSIGAEPWAGGGVVEVSDEPVLRVPLLRYGRGCPFADDRARIPEGAALVSLPDGRAWIAGGHEGETVLASVMTVRPGDTLATRSAVRFFVERTGASASLVEGDLIVLAGGSDTVGGAGEDTAEIVRVSADERVGDAFLLEPRRDHAAIAIDGGALPSAVVLSGGRHAASGPPIASVEVVTVEDERGVSASLGALEVARAGHVMLALDDGTIAIAGGAGIDGEPIAIVERLDPRARTLEVMGRFETARAEAAFVALPGGRVAQLGGREGEAWTGHVELLLEGGEAIHLADALPPLERPVAAAARGGAVLVTGRDGEGARVGVVIDPDAPSATGAIEVARAGTALVPLADGSFLEGDPSGLSVLRIDVATALDPPPASIAPAFMEDRERLALDAPLRWRARGGALEAVEDGARFDVPTLRFADVRVALSATGALELVLVSDDRPPAVIALGQDGAALGSCRIERDESAPLRVTRAGSRITLDGGRGAIDCALELPERVGLALRAVEAGAAVRRLGIERL